jgi:hypothetical protein
MPNEPELHPNDRRITTLNALVASDRRYRAAEDALLEASRNRRAAVAYALTSGITPQVVADLLGIRRQSVSDLARAAEAEPVRLLTPRERGEMRSIRPVRGRAGRQRAAKRERDQTAGAADT